MADEFGTREEVFELFKHLLKKGLVPSVVGLLTSDLFKILEKAEEFSPEFVNKQLKEKGYKSIEVDDEIINIVLGILRKEVDGATKSGDLH